MVMKRQYPPKLHEESKNVSVIQVNEEKEEANERILNR